MKQMLCCASYRLCQVKFACSTISFHTIHTQQKLLENYYQRECGNSVSWFHRRKSNWKFKNKREISVRKDLSLSSPFVKFSGMASDIPSPLLWFRSLQSQRDWGTSLFKVFERPYYFYNTNFTYLFWMFAHLFWADYLELLDKYNTKQKR